MKFRKVYLAASLQKTCQMFSSGLGAQYLNFNFVIKILLLAGLFLLNV